MRTRHPFHRLRSARLVAVACVAVLVLASCDLAPDEDPFYLDAGAAPGAEAGDVIAARPSVFTLDPVGQTPAPGVSSWQVVYQSENATGEDVAVSGTVLVPTTPWAFGPRPVVGYTVGTRGLGDRCAPSYTLSQGADYEGLFINALLAQGWAVAVSDYEGLGTPGTHTYMVGPAQGRAALDVVRAAQRLPEAGLSPDAPVGLMGYSQGGGAAGWAAELAPTYAPELDVVGAAVGGVPGDLAATAEFLDGNLAVAFALMAAVGLDTAYDELDLDSYLNDRGRELVATADELCLVSVDGFSTLIGTAFTDIDDYVTTNPLDTPAWQARLAEQELGHVSPGVPVFQYHGLVDEIVPYGQARDLRRSWCNRGTRVTWTSLPGEHLLGMVEGQPLAVTWLGARFAGLPSLGNCWLP
jgi:hypothetical protein